MRRSLGISLALALGLSLPTAGLGFILDDTKLLLDAEGSLPATRPLDYFSFARDPQLLHDWVRSGPYPWWTLPQLKLAFCRPLSSALIRLDSLLFGRAAWAWHLHSIAWFLLLILAVSALYRRALGAAAGGLALIMFALDDVHWAPVGWLANRNALVAAVPVTLGLVAWLRFREDGWGPGRWLAALGVAVGLAGGEGALGFVAYFAAYELASARPVRERLVALAPVAAVVVAWAALYRGFGYGASFSSIYVDPGKEPLAFLAIAPSRLLIELGALTLKASGDFWIVVPALRRPLVGIGLAGAAIAALALRHFWSRFEDGERRAVRWLLPGALLSLGPGLATFPADRLLLASTLGAMGVFAVLLRTARREHGRGARATVVWLTLVTLVLPPVGWVAGPYGFQRWARASEASVVSADPALFEKPVVLLNCLDFGAVLYGGAWLKLAGRERPRHWWPIAIDPNAHRLRRLADQALELQSVGGRMLATPFEQMVRSERFPLAVGHAVELDGLTVTVLDVDGGWPTRLRLDFARPLSDYSLLAWRPGKFVPLTPPVGDEVLELEAQPSPMEFHF